MKKFLVITFISIIVLGSLAILTLEIISKNNMPVPNDYNELVQVNTEKPETEEASEAVEKELITIPEAEELTFAFPVTGEIGLNYSPSNLIYSKTLQEWTVHNGIDIRAKRGTPVVSAAAGKVENITETADKGIEITISHDDGYKTVYSNLSSKNMVKIGQKVEKMQVISGIGNTAAFEYYEPDHLHFEVYKDNKLINPTSILLQ